MKNKMTIKEAKEKNLCPRCGDWDPGYIRCNAADGTRCGECERLQREGLQDFYGQGLPFDHICDDCAGLGTFDGYEIYNGRS